MSIYKKYCKRMLKQYGKHLKKSSSTTDYERFKIGAED